MKICKVNICWNITELTRDELEKWKFENPELQENYFIIDEYENNKL